MRGVIESASGRWGLLVAVGGNSRCNFRGLDGGMVPLEAGIVGVPLWGSF